MLVLYHRPLLTHAMSPCSRLYIRSNLPFNSSYDKGFGFANIDARVVNLACADDIPTVAWERTLPRFYPKAKIYSLLLFDIHADLAPCFALGHRSNLFSEQDERERRISNGES